MRNQDIETLSLGPVEPGSEREPLHHGLRGPGGPATNVLWTLFMDSAWGCTRQGTSGFVAGSAERKPPWALLGPGSVAVSQCRGGSRGQRQGQLPGPYSPCLPPFPIRKRGGPTGATGSGTRRCDGERTNRGVGSAGDASAGRCVTTVTTTTSPTTWATARGRG